MLLRFCSGLGLKASSQDKLNRMRVWVTRTTETTKDCHLHPLSPLSVVSIVVYTHIVFISRQCFLRRCLHALGTYRGCSCSRYLLRMYLHGTSWIFPALSMGKVLGSHCMYTPSQRWGCFFMCWCHWSQNLFPCFFLNAKYVLQWHPVIIEYKPPVYSLACRAFCVVKLLFQSLGGASDLTWVSWWSLISLRQAYHQECPFPMILPRSHWVMDLSGKVKILETQIPTGRKKIEYFITCYNIQHP